MEFRNDRNFAEAMDEQDSLRAFRDRFLIPVAHGREKIYFLGNSLGLQPVSVKNKISEVLDQWALLGVEGFFEGSDPWLNYHDKLSGPLSRIVGAGPSEIVVMNQLTVNLHLMMTSFYKPSGKRIKILCEKKAFPSDQYMLESMVRARGLEPEKIIVEISPGVSDTIISQSSINEKIRELDDELALVFFGGVQYYTGQRFDMEEITREAHRVGALAGFDLAHATGNVEIRLNSWNVDFACWCSYKYLNSGPGAIAGAYIHERYHNDPRLSRLAGWWGFRKEERFQMKSDFVPEPSAQGWQLSTPSILLYATHLAALEIFEEAGMNRILKKGKQLSDYLFFLLDAFPEALKNKFRILTPSNYHERGCQLSLLFEKDGRKVFDHLTASGVFADWREPGVIRVAPVPLYNRFAEVYEFSRILYEALGNLH